ncbi:transmembrane protein 150A-like isoform X2 [Hemicordylus capensis]|uniref:transmembrane protein 150A-like isoform X2 n=1 Tax=Hemicordylus capensis TaxID=884348 RepID=UPI0023033A98|nr:transmembrane protein 150A-like isoform X2 [Hemicordylus capensis]
MARKLIIGPRMKEVRYAMALSNNHICPVHNWIYNQSCELDSPMFCCTLDHVPLVSKCGTFPPESCFFSLICSLGSFMVMLVGLLRYAHVIEHYGSSLLNTLGLATGWICAAGLIMVGNFQVDHAKVLHYIGAGVAFPTSMLFLFFQSILTYRMAKSKGHYWTGHLRSILAALAFITLIFSILSAVKWFGSKECVQGTAGVMREGELNRTWLGKLQGSWGQGLLSFNSALHLLDCGSFRDKLPFPVWLHVMSISLLQCLLGKKQLAKEKQWKENGALNPSSALPPPFPPVCFP